MEVGEGVSAAVRETLKLGAAGRVTALSADFIEGEVGQVVGFKAFLSRNQPLMVYHRARERTLVWLSEGGRGAGTTH